jgi:thioredoxin
MGYHTINGVIFMKKFTIVSLTLTITYLTTYFLCANINIAPVENIIYLHQQQNALRSPDATFNSLIGTGNVIAVFYAEWCGPCNRMAPIVAHVASQLSNITFIKINRDNFKDLAKKYNNRGIPTFLFFKNGVLVHEHFGSMPEEEFVALINNVYKNNL